MHLYYLFVSKIEEWDLIDKIVLLESSRHGIVWLGKDVLLRFVNRSNFDWVKILATFGIICDEGLVRARLRGSGWLHVLVVNSPVDDLVVDHVGKVLKTIKLDPMGVCVDDYRVVAGAASAR